MTTNQLTTEEALELIRAQGQQPRVENVPRFASWSPSEIAGAMGFVNMPYGVESPWAVNHGPEDLHRVMKMRVAYGPSALLDIPRSNEDGWVKVTSLEQATALDGKTVEIDAFKCQMNGGVLLGRGAEPVVLWSGASGPHGLRLRVVEAKPSDGWVEVTTLEEARTLDGKMVEVDATGILRQIKELHGETRIANFFAQGGYGVGPMLSVSGYPVWVESDGALHPGLRLRVVEAKPDTIADVQVSSPLKVAMGFGVEPLREEWTGSLPKHETLDRSPPCVGLTLRDHQAAAAQRIGMSFRPEPDQGMRPELAAALARQGIEEQPATRRCPSCKGEGTLLLTTACPTCKGARVVAVAKPVEGYTYRHFADLLGGDQIWWVEKGKRDSTAPWEYVLTRLDVANGVLSTTAFQCTRNGKPITEHGETKPLPGSFVGEHHGERAILGYINHLNASPGR